MDNELKGELKQLFDEQRRETFDGYGQIIQKLERLDGRIARVQAEIGPKLPDPDSRGDRDTVQGRLHRLEGERKITQDLIRVLAGKIDDMSDQVKLMSPTVAQLKTAYDREQLLHQAQTQSWNKRGRLFMFGFAAVGALGTIVSIVTIVFR